MQEPIKIGVIGTGALGKEHVRLYAELARTGQVQLIGVYDHARDLAAAIAHKHNTRAFTSLTELLEHTQAVSIVTPTHTHYEIAKSFLTAGRHVLLEKPMTETALQAADLVRLAQETQCALQVGHVERFNPILGYLEKIATEPRFIEAHRLSPFPARSTDIGVVLDLMIHDLDVVLALVKSPVAQVQAVGIPVLSSSEDIANARLQFENGCVANLTASRISPERMRKIRVFSTGPNTSYVSLDYRAQEGYIYRLAHQDEHSSSLLRDLLAGRKPTLVSEFGGKRILREPVPLEKGEPLKLELQSFIDCVRARKTPVVSGEAGKLALDLALEITAQISPASIP